VLISLPKQPKSEYPRSSATIKTMLGLGSSRTTLPEQANNMEKMKLKIAIELFNGICNLIDVYIVSTIPLQ
jgi:hypothetical protein